MRLMALLLDLRTVRRKILLLHGYGNLHSALLCACKLIRARLPTLLYVRSGEVTSCLYVVWDGDCRI